MVGNASNAALILSDRALNTIGFVVSPLNDSVNVPEPPVQPTL